MEYGHFVYYFLRRLEGRTDVRYHPSALPPRITTAGVYVDYMPGVCFRYLFQRQELLICGSI